MGFILFATASRLALVLTQLPIRWSPGALSPEAKRPWREADHSLPSKCRMLRMSGVITSAQKLG